MKEPIALEEQISDRDQAIGENPMKQIISLLVTSLKIALECTCMTTTKTTRQFLLLVFVLKAHTEHSATRVCLAIKEQEISGVQNVLVQLRVSFKWQA